MHRNPATNRNGAINGKSTVGKTARKRDMGTRAASSQMTDKGTGTSGSAPAPTGSRGLGRILAQCKCGTNIAATTSGNRGRRNGTSRALLFAVSTTDRSRNMSGRLKPSSSTGKTATVGRDRAANFGRNRAFPPMVSASRYRTWSKRGSCLNPQKSAHALCSQRSSVSLAANAAEGAMHVRFVLTKRGPTGPIPSRSRGVLRYPRPGVSLFLSATVRTLRRRFGKIS